MVLSGRGRGRARRLWGARLWASVLAVMLVAAPVGAAPSASQGVPPAPTGLGGTVGWDRAELSWDDPGDPAVIGYQVLRRDKGVQGVGVFSVLVDDTGDAVTEFRDDTVEPGRRYVYRVKARSATGLSKWSRWLNADTPAAPGPAPAAPTGLLGSVSHDSVVLAWDDPGDASVVGYRVYRRDRAQQGVGQFDVIEGDTGDAVTGFTDDTVEPGRRYVYRVKARSATGMSQWSRWFNADTPAAPGPDVRGLVTASEPEFEVVWSSVLSVGGFVGVSPTTSGYSQFVTSGGSLSVDEFVVDGVSVGVAAVLDHGGLVLGLSRELPRDFVLRLGGREFVGSDSFEQVIAAAGRYWWPSGPMGWSVDDEVELSIAMGGSGAVSGRPPAPPSAYFQNMPASHDGESPFEVDLVFDEADLVVDAGMLKDHALAVAGAEVVGVRRYSPASVRSWTVSLRPVGVGDVVVSLRAVSDCALPDAVCSSDGRGLRADARAVAAGPGAAAGSLLSLDVRGAVLDPAFADNVYEYAVTAGDGVDSVTLVAETASLAASSVILPEDADPGRPGHQIRFVEPTADDRTPTAEVTVTVTSQDGSVTRVYTVAVNRNLSSCRDNATDLGDITDVRDSRFDSGSFDGSVDAVVCYRFELIGTKRVGLGLSEQAADADLLIEDPDGLVLFESRTPGTADESLAADLAAGTYYVRLEAQEAGTGGYTLRYSATHANPLPIEPPPEDDFPEDDFPEDDEVHIPDVTDPPQMEVGDYAADISTTGRIAVGGWLITEADTGTDRDWFAVDFEAGRMYQIEVTGSNWGTGTLLAPRLYSIRDSSGERIRGALSMYQTWWLGKEQAFFVPTENGTHYVDTGSFFVAASESGTYRVSVSEILDDFTATTETAGVVEVGGSATGALNYYFDRDWFAVDFEAGKSYELKLLRDGPGTSSLIVYGIYDSTGSNISNRNDTLKSLSYFEPKTDGTYYLGVRERRGLSVGYSVSVAEVEDDFAAATLTSGVVEVGGPAAEGVIDFMTDQDWFAVELEAAKMYRTDVRSRYVAGSHNRLDAPHLDAVFDPDGRRISNTVAYDGGHAIGFFVPPQDGTYYVSAADFYDDVGDYSVAVSEVVDDFGADADTAGTIRVGGSVRGEIHFDGVSDRRPDDQDWFAVALEAGTTYQIDLQGVSTGAGSLPSPRLLGIRDSSGALLAGTANRNGGVGYDSRKRFTPNQDGTYYIEVDSERVSYVGTKLGTYTVRVGVLVDGEVVYPGPARSAPTAPDQENPIDVPG